MRKLLDELRSFFSDAEAADEPGYDPVHFGAMIVGVLCALSVLFWLLWSLLVFGGGIQAKIVPLVLVLFTSKTFADFGYVGYPYEMGVFEGWVTNAVALVFAAALAAVLIRLFSAEQEKNRNGNCL